MASSGAPDETIFETLRKGVDPQLQEEKLREAAARQHAVQVKEQRRLAELIDSNSSLPCTISSIRVLNAPHTRKTFLSRIFDPIITANKERPYTLAEAIREVSIGADKLHRYDIFHQPISLFIDRPSKTDPSSTPTDIDIYLSVREKSRLLLKTGTDVGNAEGSAYGNLLLRNIFGGAESLNLNASLGTRTRSSYQAAFEAPIPSATPGDLRAEIGGLASSTQNAFASHEEVLKGAWTKTRWISNSGTRHELSYSGTWRQITGLGSSASPTVRGDAGDSFKSSITHTYINDRRDNALLPTRGYFTKTLLELAGWGPLQGDVAFAKTELQTQGAIPIPLPGVQGDSGVSLSTGFRAGLLYPLSLGFDFDSKPTPSRINDRFQLGGPADVRGFRLSGLGPRDGADSVGGDLYAAGSANLLFPIPRVGVDRPFRFQAFVNGGGYSL
ncbi:hypothetical protein G7Y79_00041g078020 [Physcia stellaris]|nr:hypothetical protein G7Y79_00041g078020 [Physcia stellaris]